MTEQEQKFNPLETKKVVEQKGYDRKTSLYQGNTIRRLVLCSRGDSLSNDELYNHYKEYRRLRLAKLLTYTLIPGATYYCFKKPKYVILSLLPALTIDIALQFWLRRPTTSSFKFGEKSYDSYIRLTLAMNLLGTSTHADKWNPTTINHKEFFERNSYR
jgi:hypothetical protein